MTYNLRLVNKRMTYSCHCKSHKRKVFDLTDEIETRFDMGFYTNRARPNCS